MRNLLIAVVIVMSAGTPAAASDTTDVLETAHRWTDAFNRGSFKTDVAPCAEDAVVIDGLQPYVWQGPGACSSWYEAVAKPVNFRGIVTMTLRKGESGWRVSGRMGG